MNEQNRLGSRSIIYSLFSVVLLVCYFLPQAKMFVGYVELTMATAAFSAFYIATTLAKRRLLYNTIVWGVLFCMMMFLVAWPLNFKYGFLHPLMVVWLSVFPAFLAYNTIMRNNVWEKRIIFYAGIILFLWVVYSTLQIMRENPDIVRNMTGVMDEELRHEMVLLGVGGYGIAYASGALSILLFGLSFAAKNKFKFRVLLFAAFLFTFYFVLNAQFATLLLITLASLAAVLFFTSKSNVLRFILICFVPLLLIFLPDIIEYIINIYQGQTVADRLGGALQTLQGKSDIENISGYRSQYQAAALELFLQSPIWGNDISSGIARGVFRASHSTFLSFLAATGIIGVYFYYKALWNATRLVFINWGKRLKDVLLLPLLIYFCLLTILNPTSETLELYVTVFATIPLAVDLFIIHAKKYDR